MPINLQVHEASALNSRHVYNRPIVDAHMHIWDTTKMQYPWLRSIKKLGRAYSINDYQKQTETLTVEKIIFVQCECLPEQFLQEINYVSNAAGYDSRIKGIVSWFPLEKKFDIGLVNILLQNPLLRGFRCVQQSPKSIYTQVLFISNVKRLAQYNLSFDLCVQASQLAAALNLVEQCPDVNFMLDHAGKPNVPALNFAEWKKAIKEIAACPKVYCKVSGLVPESEFRISKLEEMKPFFEHIVEHFGFNRLVFGSDWPVVTLSSSFVRWFDTLLALSKDFSDEDLLKMIYKNACDFYRI